MKHNITDIQDSHGYGMLTTTSGRYTTTIGKYYNPRPGIDTPSEDNAWKWNSTILINI